MFAPPVAKTKAKTPSATASTHAPKTGQHISGPDLHSHPILHLQRTIGNQAVQRLLQTHAEELSAGLTGTASPPGHDFSRIPVHPPAAGAIQTKSAVNKPGDVYEQEADHVAEQMMRIPEPQLQRACACSGGCPKCQSEQPGQEQERLQTKRVQASDTGQTTAPPIVHEVLRSPGQPLDRATRAFMEPRFGHDFSQVRVHSDSKGAESARAVQARAYTVGHDIVFGSGQYAAATTEGKRLLTHELVHVVQQAAGANVLQRQRAPTDDSGEIEWQAWKTKALAELAAMSADIERIRRIDLPLLRLDASLKQALAEIALEQLRIAYETADKNARKWARRMAIPKIVLATYEAAIACPAASTGIGAIGCIHALGTYKSSWDELWSGEPSPTPIHQSAAAIAGEFTDKRTADLIGAWVDTLIGIGTSYLTAKYSTPPPTPNPRRALPPASPAGTTTKPPTEPMRPAQGAPPLGSMGAGPGGVRTYRQYRQSTPQVENLPRSSPAPGEPAYSANPRPAPSTRPMKTLPGGARRGSMGGGAETPVAYPQSRPNVEVRTPSTPQLGKPDYSVTPQTPGPDPWGSAPRPARPATPRALPGHHSRTAQAAQEAQALGLQDLQKGRAGMQEHKTAPAVRKATGIAGKGYESTHLVPQAVYRAIGANPDNAPTVNVPKSVNNAIDAGWVSKWKSAVRLSKQITGADVRNWVGQGIQNVPETLLSQVAKNTLEFSFEVELRGLGITANTVIVPGIP